MATTNLSRVRVRLATKDPDEAFAALRQIYNVRRSRVTGSPETFFHTNATEGTERFSVTRFRFSDHIEVSTQPMGFLMVGRVLGGRYSGESRSGRIDSASGRPFLLPHDEAVEATGTEMDLGLVNFDLDFLQTAAGLGDQQLRFSGTRPVSDAAARRWNAALDRMMTDVIGAEKALDSILLRDASSREMAQMLLRTFPSNALDPDLDCGEPAAYAAVRRALAFIESHAAEPITVDQIALAARLSPRGVQAAFRRHLGRSPMEHLRRIRLDAVHEELRAADPFGGDTVAAVAQRWGFGHLGRFAAAYRAQYGEPPRQTLDS